MNLAGVATEQQISSAPVTDRFPSPGKWALALGCLLVFATLALYHPVIHYPFASADDNSYIADNRHVKYGFEWDTVTWAFTTFSNANWHPLTWLSHALDVHLYSLDAGKHHRTNVILHTVNAVLLFWVLLSATGYVGRSAMVAALFALHPINVESVVWISERKNVLSMLFFLLALGAYRWYVLRPRAGRYSVVAFLYALALMAKPQVITFPFVLLLWDYWPLRRMFAENAKSPATRTPAITPAKSSSWLVWEKLPLFALAVASAVITVIAQRSGGAMSGAQNTYPFLLRLENAIVSYVRYLGKAVWPSQPRVHVSPLLVCVVASVRSAAVVACHHGVSHRRSSPPVSAGGVVLVSGNAGTHDWIGAGRGPGNGRPLCLSAARGPFPHELLGRCRLG